MARSSSKSTGTTLLHWLNANQFCGKQQLTTRTENVSVGVDQSSRAFVLEGFTIPTAIGFETSTSWTKEFSRVAMKPSGPASYPVSTAANHRLDCAGEVSSMAKCLCTASCPHHTGKACSNEGYTVSSSYLVGVDEWEEGKPVSFNRCLKCMVAEEVRRKEAEAAAKAASMKQPAKSS